MLRRFDNILLVCLYILIFGLPQRTKTAKTSATPTCSVKRIYELAEMNINCQLTQSGVVNDVSPEGVAVKKSYLVYQASSSWCNDVYCCTQLFHDLYVAPKYTKSDPSQSAIPHLHHRNRTSCLCGRSDALCVLSIYGWQKLPSTHLPGLSMESQLGETSRTSWNYHC